MLNANTDRDLEAAIRSNLREQPGIGVQVTDAIATLTGHVASIHDRLEAERMAQRTPNVVGIANEIQVTPSVAGQIEDTRIVRRAVAAIREELPPEHRQVRAIVRDGFVTLEGSVTTLTQRERLEAQVRAISGITGVSNLISIAAGNPAAGDALRDD